MKYKKKTETVEAEQWFPGVPTYGIIVTPEGAKVDTNYGPVNLSPGDWVVNYGKDVFVVYTDHEFRSKYEPAKEIEG